MFDEDLSIFFEDFGIEVVFTRADDPDDPIAVATATLILNAPTLDASVYDRSFYDEKFYAARVHQARMELLGIAAQVADVKLNDVATYNSENWYVIDLEPDGTGLTILVLSANPISA